jgi:hypothetical protein
MLTITLLIYVNMITQAPLFRMDFKTYGRTIETIAKPDDVLARVLVYSLVHFNSLIFHVQKRFDPTVIA